ncbi:CRISPR-associated protein, Csx11 family [Desulfonauticus submarinus]|uniref:CRISPR-associated protein, Csx11 family n=1 Tax=Desulfonauticus submarinus TaxID=206665 RepID=A0A1H0DNP6_9BACT|nr:CRISPR-associated protein Csx11 [Desulfonauticus submarinus]SDN71698.1 CRISPR-associated protein, Csx11 family [Desulfonauticus submarinus]
MGLKELIEKRNDILFAEIGALIHDLGKLSKEFVESKTEDGNYNWFRHEEILKNNNTYNSFLPNKLKQIFEYKKDNQPYYKELKDSIDNIPTHVNGKTLSIAEFLLKQFISKHHSGNSLFPVNFLSSDSKSKGADSVDSAIDKMVSEEYEYVLQSKTHTYISTAFGYEFQKIDLDLSDIAENSLTTIRENYANKLTEILENLKNNSKVENWIEKRDELLAETKKAFLNALGETRRPANDVTLWDHSFSVASLYKAALAEVVINEWKEPKEIKWKLLSIRFNGDEFYYTAPKIADVLGRKVLVEKILDKIKTLLEVVVPIGNEIYRDENGSVFLVPESAKDEIFEISDIWEKIKDIEFKGVALNFKGEWEKKCLEEIIDDAPQNLKKFIEKISSFMSAGIFIPEIELSKPSRGALNLGKEISEERKYNTDLEELKQKWTKKENNYEKCTVCGLKPVPFSNEEKENLDKKILREGWQNLSEEEKNQYKAYERKICIDCLKFSFNRVEEWRKNHFETSIWLDEIADENNRIALVYLSFDLEKWLSGEMLNTFLSKPIKVLKEAGLSFDNYEDIIQHIIENFNNKDEIWNVLEPYSKDKTGKEIFDDIVKSRDENWRKTYKTNGGDVDENDTETKVKILFLNLIRKHPSFARLRRTWETTKSFGIDIFEKAKSKLKTRKRMIITFDFNGNLQIAHTYWFKDKSGKDCELVVIEKQNKAAVISDSENIEVPDDKKLELYNENFKNHITTISNVTIQEKKEYFPLIPYLFEPSKTLFFMPLKEVWEIIQLIKKEYEVQFNKVQNRLPINIGFVAFHKKTPMYAVLDAAKRMYSRNSDKEVFEIYTVDEIDAQKNCRLYGGRIGNKVKEIKFKNAYEYHFSYSTGDPEKEDLFHPYFIMENSNGWKTYVEGDWKTIKHVKDLHEGDEVSFYPSCFDFLWLDTNTRKLDVGESRIHWLFKEFSPKPYNIKDIESFEELRILLLEKLKLTASQLLNVYGLLISKLEEWQLPNKKLPIDDNVFEDFIKNAILSIPLRLKIASNTEKGKITRDDFEFLKATIMNGMFFDFIDMWHTILKRKFKEDE